MADDLDHAAVQPQIFGSPAAGDDESVVLLRLDFGERGSSGNYGRAFRCRFGTVEIVDRGGDRVARFFVGANGIDLMADHQQHLKRDHHFVVFHEVSDEHEDFFDGHGRAGGREQGAGTRKRCCVNPLDDSSLKLRRRAGGGKG